MADDHENMELETEFQPPRSVEVEEEDRLGSAGTSSLCFFSQLELIHMRQ